MNGIEGALVLADGTEFKGRYLGANLGESPAAGEVVFHTAMCGYQEVLTDPSYAGQIVTFTYPHIGNYGVNEAFSESEITPVRGMIAREVTEIPSNWQSQGSLIDFLKERNLGCITDIDTRKLTRILRDAGSLSGAFGPTSGPGAFTMEQLHAAAKADPGTNGIDLVAEVTTEQSYTVGSGDYKVVAFDFGIKRGIIEQLAKFSTVTVVPASTTSGQVLDMNPDGVFLSNGPGDPTEVPYAIKAISELLGKVPIFGICLGHQLLSLAIGGKIIKLPFGHHGANHPLKNLSSGEVEITSQNHNFAVDAESVKDRAEVTHINLNDDVCEGIRLKDGSAFSVQHHPEANPGPRDSEYLFSEFKELMESNA